MKRISIQIALTPNDFISSMKYNHSFKVWLIEQQSYNYRGQVYVNI